MKKIIQISFFSTLAMVSWVFPFALSAQIFQNSNTACEVRTVCTSGTGNCFGDSQSISCRNQGGIADFNGDGFPDCVAENGTWSTPAEDNTSVLLNNGAGVTCGTGSGQLANGVNYAEPNATGGTASIATVLAGPLSPGAISSVILPYVSTDPNLATDTPNASGILPETPDYTSIFSVLAGGFSASTKNRTTAMLDCNGDNYLDVVVTGEETNLILVSTFQILDVAVNDQAGGFTVSSASVLNVTGTTGSDSAVSVGDFNNDGILDVAVLTDVKTGAVDDQISACIGDGACGFTCSSVVDVNAANPGSDLATFSATTIAAGDFNGDGIDDMVIGITDGLNEVRGIQYYYNTPAALNTYSAPTTVEITNTNLQFPSNIAAGFFNNDSILDVAAVLPGESGDLGPSLYLVTSANASGGLNAPLLLNYSSNPDTDNLEAATSLDVADFDLQGCDDIAGLATNATTGDRGAYIFMNALESLTVDAGAGAVAGGGVNVQLTGTCTLSPEDTTTTASSIVPTWTIVGSPAGAALSNANTLTPTFTGTANGVYTVQLSCQSQCVAATTDTTTVVVDLNLEGSGSCSFNPFATFSMFGIGMIACNLAFFFGFRRKK